MWGPFAFAQLEGGLGRDGDISLLYSRFLFYDLVIVVSNIIYYVSVSF